MRQLIVQIALAFLEEMAVEIKQSEMMYAWDNRPISKNHLESNWVFRSKMSQMVQSGHSNQDSVHDEINNLKV